MAVEFNTASLSIQLYSETHSMSEVGSLVEILQSLPMVSFWASIFNQESEDDEVIIARKILSEDVLKDGNDNRFFPHFKSLVRHLDDPFALIELSDYFKGLDPFNVMDVAVMQGINIWARKLIYLKNRQLSYKLFDYAQVSRLEHYSPLLIELSIILGGAIALPILLTYGIMRAVASNRRAEAENQIRENEAKIKNEEFKQKQIQTIMLEEIHNAMDEQKQREGYIKVPEKVMENVAGFAVSPIAELGKSPLIDKVSFSIISKT